MQRMPPDIEAMVNELLDANKRIVGENKQRQFALLLTSLGAWIEEQPNPARWIGFALDTLGKHRTADQERCDG